MCRCSWLRCFDELSKNVEKNSQALIEALAIEVKLEVNTALRSEPKHTVEEES